MTCPLEILRLKADLIAKAIKAKGFSLDDNEVFCDFLTHEYLDGSSSFMFLGEELIHFLPLSYELEMDAASHITITFTQKYKCYFE